MFKFQEGASVTLKDSKPALGLAAGDTGAVWALYDTQPPAYEVLFHSAQNHEFSMVLSEEELLEPAVRKSRATAAA